MHIKHSKPEFCVITPTDYLEYTKMSKSHLALAHLVATDQTYANFYSELDDSNFIIMDNGAFELGESYDPDMLLTLAENCRADAIVLPDFPFQSSQKTIDGCLNMIDSIKAEGYLAMFVPQSQTGDIEDWIDCYTFAVENPDIDIIGMSILGIPNAIPHINKSYARVVMTQMLIDRDLFSHDKHHHYLGLNSGPALEIPSLLNMGALDTCDSSNPVWTAILGHEYSENCDSFLNVSKPKLNVDFNLEWLDDDDTHSRIETNLAMTLDLFEI